MPTLQSVAAVHTTHVLDKTEIAPGVILLGLYAPDLVRVTRPGHFVMVVPPLGQTAAVALGVYEAQGDRASVLFMVTGARTRELAGVALGAQIELFGPLGNGFDLSAPIRYAAIVAGGVGIASLLLPAQALLAAGVRVSLYYGARTKTHLVETAKFIDAGCEIFLATDDGSAGHHGVITEPLAKTADIPEVIFACGPSPMLRAVGSVARALGTRAQLSLEETFACGVGACWGCTVRLDPRSAQAPPFPVPSANVDGTAASVNARICKEGPVFWAHELRW